MYAQDFALYVFLRYASFMARLKYPRESIVQGLRRLKRVICGSQSLNQIIAQN